MIVELTPWSTDMKDELIRVKNAVKRGYPSGQTPTPYTARDADRCLKRVSEHEGHKGIFRAIVVDGEVVGDISADRQDDMPAQEVEVGYGVVTDHRSKGIATEATRQICDIVFRELDVVRITAQVAAPNIASMRVLEKNGFVRDGVIPNGTRMGGRIHDRHNFYKLKPAAS